MTFTGRIRTSLLLVAVVPPLLIMSVIYWQGLRQSEQADRREALQALERFDRYYARTQDDINIAIASFLDSKAFANALALARSGRTADIALDAIPADLDFLELLDAGFVVTASRHRPGLIGETVRIKNHPVPLDSLTSLAVEYDRNGPHAAVSRIVAVTNNVYIYTGTYVDRRFAAVASELTGAIVRVRLAADADTESTLAAMQSGQLYAATDSLRALLLGSQEAGFYLEAVFPSGTERSVFSSLLIGAGLVAAVSTALAILLGLIISGRVRREVDNLVSATARVASGDFSTTVMAYEEGEFAQLADSFSAMTLNLSRTRQELAASEKIAAWQAMGRKIAHEIKNPLTPIAVSTDDLRRSYHEGLDNFPQILDETTGTIRTEVRRLTALLDEFVNFARMRTPEPRNVPLADILKTVTALYRREVEDGRLAITNHSTRQAIYIDSELIRQVLINLIKNGLETDPATSVLFALDDDGCNLVVRLEDDGPGFSDEILRHGFEPHVSTKKNGSGLGLVICQRIITDHGGEITLYNRPDRGAGVTIKLPVEHG